MEVRSLFVTSVLTLCLATTQTTKILAEDPIGCTDIAPFASQSRLSFDKSGLLSERSSGGKRVCGRHRDLSGLLSGFSTSKLPWIGDQLLVIPMEQTQHYPYQTREWYYYFRPYNFRHYRIQQLASHSQSRPDLPYSNSFFEDIYRDHEATRMRTDDQQNQTQNPPYESVIINQEQLEPPASAPMMISPSTTYEQ